MVVGMRLELTKASGLRSLDSPCLPCQNCFNELGRSAAVSIMLVGHGNFPCAAEMLLLLVAKCCDDGANGFLNAMPMELKSEGLIGESKLQNGELHGANI